MQRGDRMAEYHVGCGLFDIYAGTLKNGNEWRSKSEVTDEALHAVATYLLFAEMEFPFRVKATGKEYILKVEEA